jgi:hypothetical protein
MLVPIHTPADKNIYKKLSTRVFNCRVFCSVAWLTRTTVRLFNPTHPATTKVAIDILPGPDEVFSGVHHYPSVFTFNISLSGHKIRSLLVSYDFTQLLRPLKRRVPRDFRLQVFFMNQFPRSP